jgi:hypothetical protein
MVKKISVKRSIQPWLVCLAASLFFFIASLTVAITWNKIPVHKIMPFFQSLRLVVSSQQNWLAGLYVALFGAVCNCQRIIYYEK